MLRDRVSEVMTNRVVTANESSMVLEAASLMAEKNIGSIIIAEKGRVKGILTERDILRQLARGCDLSKARVSDLMTTDVITISSETGIFEAADLMVKHNFRRLPVVEGGVLVGIVTASDLMFEMNSSQVRGRVSQYMSRVVHTISSTAAVREAIGHMGKENIGCLIVTDGKELGGILTERDILRSVVARRRDLSSTRTGDVMTREIVKVESDTEISHACHLMYYYGVRRFPVVDKRENLVGVITERDLLRAMKSSP